MASAQQWRAEGERRERSGHRGCRGIKIEVDNRKNGFRQNLEFIGKFSYGNGSFREHTRKTTNVPCNTRVPSAHQC